MIKIYGMPRSSAGRCFLMLEELGLPYEQVQVDMRNREHKSENFLKLNPNGKIPVLTDGDFTIWESAAINHYLADKYRPELLGRTSEERGLQQQWTTWAMVDLQPPLVDLIIQFMFTPDEKRNLTIVAKARESVPPMLKILDNALEGKDYILGATFTLADINLFSVVNIASSFEFNLATMKNLKAWYDRIKTRPATQKVMDLRAQH